MERLTVPDKKIEGGTRTAIIDARAVREEAMTIYWALKKYEDTGLTPEQIRELQMDYAVKGALLAEYHAIGTVEECRKAREKQRAKKPPDIVDSDIENGGSYGDCPSCGEHLESLWTSERFCQQCGQRIDWSVEE